MCDDELTLMMYVDGELEAELRPVVASHVERCDRCRAVVTALRGEQRELRAALCDDGLPPVRAAALVASLVAGVGLLRVAVEAVLPSAALPGWLNPLHSDGASSLLLTALGYGFQEGERIMGSLMVGAVSAACIVLMPPVFELARRCATSGVIAGLVVLAAWSPAEALEVRRSAAAGGVVAVAADETVDDTLFAFGDTVDVDGLVTGDVIAMARRVRIRGTVRGSVLAMGRDVEVAGTVEGSVLQVGQSTAMRGQGARNLYAFAQTVTLAADARVGGNVMTFGESAAVEGAVGQDLTSFGRALDLAGTVSRRVTAYGERVDVRAGARVEGDLTAHVGSNDAVRVDPGATVGGRTSVEVEPPAPSAYATAGFYFRQFLRLAAAFVTGWLFFWLVPGAAAMRLDNGTALATAAGAGLVALCATPLIALLAGITLVGLPVALVVLAAWLLLLYLAKIALARVLGRVLVGPGSLAAALLAGLVVILIAVNIPYVGGLLNLVLTVVGLGILVLEIASWSRRARPVPVPPVPA